jgi:hypothetical protein
LLRVRHDHCHTMFIWGSQRYEMTLLDTESNSASHKGNC